MQITPSTHDRVSIPSNFDKQMALIKCERLDCKAQVCFIFHLNQSREKQFFTLRCETCSAVRLLNVIRVRNIVKCSWSFFFASVELE